MFHELGECDPARGVHVQMVLVLDVLLVHLIGSHSFGAESVSMVYAMKNSRMR